MSIKKLHSDHYRFIKTYFLKAKRHGSQSATEKYSKNPKIVGMWTKNQHSDFIHFVAYKYHPFQLMSRRRKKDTFPILNSYFLGVIRG